MIPEHLGVGDGIRHLQSDGVLNPDGLTELARFGYVSATIFVRSSWPARTPMFPSSPDSPFINMPSGSSALRMGFSDPVGRLYRRMRNDFEVN
jgi:hypothetical protein